MIRIETRDGKWQRFCDTVAGFLQADITEQMIDGKRVRGYRSPDNPALWIRDHSDIVRGGKYVESDVQSSVEVFADHQSRSGRIFDYVLSEPLRHSNERENWEKWIRIPVEADVEYRFVKAAREAWQATGDDDWLEVLLPQLEAALTYTTSSPLRWDETTGLAKRAYTIDTWDFDYTAGRSEWLNFQITDKTFWGIFHGDISGLYEASLFLGRGFGRIGNSESSERWLSFAEALRTRANKLLFNGKFYTHFHKLGSFEIAGVDESQQLSLSSPMAINRGLATPEIAASIIEEYRRRGEESDAFAEWFIIDPPFPNGVFGDEKLVPGAYVNGGVFPLCGGELARAALANGYEEYGVSILEKYRRMIETTGETYLWYYPDGSPSTEAASTSPEATATDGWGSSAMLYGLVEGLAGIVDRSHSFRDVKLRPLWQYAGEVLVEMELSYAPSGAAFGYIWERDEVNGSVSIEIKSNASDVELWVPIEAHASASDSIVSWNGTRVGCRVESSGETQFLVASGTVRGEAKAVVESRNGS